MDLSKVYNPEAEIEIWSELDEHADTCVVSANTTPLGIPKELLTDFVLEERNGK